MTSASNRQGDPPHPNEPRPGDVLATGHYTITPAADERVRSLAKASPRSGGEAHAGFALAMALGGIDTPIRQVIESCRLDFEAGAVLGRCTILWERPLAIDRDYAVAATLVSLECKASRRFGFADHLALSFAITDAEGLCVTVNTTTIVPTAAGAGR